MQFSTVGNRFSVFTELVRRILNRSNLHDPDTSTVTIFQVSEYVNTAADSIHEDLGKIVDKVALESKFVFRVVRFIDRFRTAVAVMWVLAPNVTTY